jgi:hypothetical protein
MSNQNNNKKYNTTIAPLYISETNGLISSIVITPAMYDAIQTVKVGGKFFVKNNKSKHNDTSPDLYLEYMSPERLSEFKNNAQKNQSKDSL